MVEVLLVLVAMYCAEEWVTSRELRGFNKGDDVLVEVWKRDG